MLCLMTQIKTDMKHRVRIAPSPTGKLHLGTARTALYNYLYAKNKGGDFILRLEDTDSERSREEFTKDIISGLRWLGLTWDEGPDIGGPYPPYRQTEKEEHYQNVANKLISNTYAYHCYATPEELAALKEEQSQKGLPSRYDNRGRNLTKEDHERFEAEGRVPSVRFRVEEPQEIHWDDLIKGRINVNSSDLGGDLVIVKSSGIATYNFAVVVDDIDMHMSLVMRGEDHIHNTAKQLLLFEALGQKPPQFAHAALIFDKDHKKLSKRAHGEFVHIDAYRVDGYMPEAIVNYLVQMSWNPPNNEEFFTLEEAASMFDVHKVSKSPAVFDPDKLNWFNSHYIRQLPLDVVTERARPYLTDFDLSKYSSDELKAIVAIVRESITKLSQIKGQAAFFFADKIDISEELQKEALSDETAKAVLERCISKLSDIPYGDAAGAKAVISKVGEEAGAKGKKLFQPIRAAIQGQAHGPDLGALISALGQSRVKARLEAALQLCKKN